MNHIHQRLTVLLLAMAVLVPLGCQRKVTLMPTPALYTEPGAEPFSDVPPPLQHNRVEVLFLTDRLAENDSPTDPQYGYRRSRSVAMGVAEVELGDGMSWEELVAASTTSKRASKPLVRVVGTREILRFPPSPRVMFEMRADPSTPGPTTAAQAMQAELDRDRQIAHDELAKRLALSTTKEVFIFVHGYNSTFDDSVITIAQLWHFLGRRGVPVAYSWPAGRGGLLRGYTYDRESSEFTVYHLKEMIRAIADSEDVEKIHIIAHSRGTGVLVSALSELHLEIGDGKDSAATREALKLGTVVLAAPDIDLDVLIQRAATVRLGTVPEQTAIYVCAKDQALGISNWLFSGMARLGAVRSEMFTPDELEILRTTQTLEVIDARISDPGPYGHSYYHASPAVSSDLVLLLRYGLSPGAKHGRPLQSDGSGMWYLTDEYPGPGAIPAGARAAGATTQEALP